VALLQFRWSSNASTCYHVAFQLGIIPHGRTKREKTDMKTKYEEEHSETEDKEGKASTAEA
jgi:hypothetical protein